MSFSEKKFLSLPYKKQHKNAGEYLRILFEKDLKIDTHYRQMELWLKLPSIENETEELSDRFHLHMKEASVSLQEHNLLVKRFDSLSEIPFLPIHIYLEGLRSAFNIGGILRTVEAFRLGTVVFSDGTPDADHPKVMKTAMGTSSIVPTMKGDVDTLHRPLIALETVEDGLSLFDYSFPNTFSLLLGNEEYGLKKKTLEKADVFLKIPLVGSKNSLNVASCFGIAAAFINKKLRSC